MTSFLLISYIGSRQARAPWWSASEWASTQAGNEGALKNYYIAKLAADECLTAAARKRGDGFRGIVLRPGSLTDEPAGGKVSLGKTTARGSVTREDVARVMDGLLEGVTGGGWLDLLEGNEEVGEAVRRVVHEGVDCVEGEDVEGMLKRWA